MKKNLKLVLALIVAVMMIVSSISMMAVAEDEAQSIAITGLEKGDSVQFYKILSWADDSAEATSTGAVSGWYWEEPFATKFDVNGDKGAAKLKAAINDKNQLMITDELAGEIASALNHTSGKTPVTVGNAITVSADGGEAKHTFEALAAGHETDNDGLYMAIITPGQQDTTYNPVFVHLDSSQKTDSYGAPETSEYWEKKGAAKKSTHETKKESGNDTDYNGDDGETAAVGDILDFKVTTQIPGYGKTFKKPIFKLTDTLKDLELVEDNEHKFVVKINGEEVAAGSDTYTVNKTSTSYTLDFAPEYLKGINVATDLEVTYFAKVTSSALANINKEKNTVSLEYSHDPSTENKDGGGDGGYKKYEKDVTNHYTFTIDANNLVGDEEMIGESSTEIVKISVDKNGDPIYEEKETKSNVTKINKQTSPLEGAEFALYKVTDQSGWTKEGQPYKTGLKSDVNGRIKIEGLDEGRYVLVETKAPAGYVKNSDDLKIEIKADITETPITEYYDQAGNWYATRAEAEAAETQASNNTDLDKKVGPYSYTAKELTGYSVNYNGTVSEYTFGHKHEGETEIKWSIKTSTEVPGSIVNTKGVELPSTGGMGTTIFYVGGSILVLAAAILLVTKRRMGVED